MKKKILSLLLASSLILGGFTPANVSAKDAPSESSSIATARPIELGTSYNVTWSNDHPTMYVSFDVTKRGIIDMNISKVSNHNTLTCIYDSHGELVWSYQDIHNTNPTNTSLVHVGLEKGHYYASFKPTNTSGIAGKTASYTFSLTPEKYCECESNDTKELASEAEVDAKIVGYLGCGISSGVRDNGDAYYLTLKKGHVYKLKSNPAKEGRTITKIVGKDVKLHTTSAHNSSANKFIANVDDEFVAPYSGTYYLSIWNYHEKQYRYELSVIDITPLATTISSVKAKSKAFTVKWKLQKNASGYEIQYGTKSNFAGAKSVVIDDPKTASATIKSLTSKKKYYVRVRCFKRVDRLYGYSKWSKSASVIVK